MKVFESTDYKATLREKIRLARGKSRGMTMKTLADKIPVQYTYLSKALRDPKTHLNEDHLFCLCRMLHIVPEEMDFIFLQRQWEITQDATRKLFLQNKLNRFRSGKEAVIDDALPFDDARPEGEMGYLFDPLCILVHVALFIDEIAQNPRRLCGPLGVSPEQLTHILKKLSELKFVELKANGTAKPLKDQVQYGSHHPLMGVHQALLRSLSSAQLLKTPGQQKHSIMTTFAAEPEVFKQIQKKFQIFLKEVETLILKSHARHCFQLNFDLFQWI